MTTTRRQTRRAVLTGSLAGSAAAGAWSLCPRLGAALAAQPATGPVRNGARRWRIGYCESMAYGNYAATLVAILKGLERLGWTGDLTGLPYSPGQTDTTALWAWMAGRPDARFLEFVPDAHASGLDPGSVADVAERLRTARDIDLMIVMGTVAGIALGTGDHAVPVLVFSSTNPVAAGIVASEDDPGSDHVWAHLDPRRFQRQLAIFHKTFGFGRLGITYEDTPSGRAIASLPDIEAAAERLGFDLIEQYVQAPADEADQPRYEAEVRAAWNALSQSVDAMYITYGRWPMERFPALIRPFVERRVPTFSQLGPEEVEKGALMSIARADMAGVGAFGAATIARTLRGEPLRRLPQVYFDTPSIAWNVATAEAIGHPIPFPALLAADALYGVP